MYKRERSGRGIGLKEISKEGIGENGGVGV